MQRDSLDINLVLIITLSLAGRKQVNLLTVNPSILKLDTLVMSRSCCFSLPEMKNLTIALSAAGLVVGNNTEMLYL